MIPLMERHVGNNDGCVIHQQGALYIIFERVTYLGPVRLSLDSETSLCRRALSGGRRSGSSTKADTQFCKPAEQTRYLNYFGFHLYQQTIII